LLHAPRDWRVSRIAELYHANVKSAAAEVDRLDAARTHWAQEYYDMHWGDTQHYDLTIDVSRFGIEGSGRLIAHAVERRRAHG
jgi:cytidylate kinase